MLFTGVCQKNFAVSFFLLIFANRSNTSKTKMQLINIYSFIKRIAKHNLAFSILFTPPPPTPHIVCKLHATVFIEKHCSHRAISCFASVRQRSSLVSYENEPEPVVPCWHRNRENKLKKQCFCSSLGFDIKPNGECCRNKK